MKQRISIIINLYIFAIFSILIALVYSNTLKNEFHFDSLHHIVTNNHFQVDEFEWSRLKLTSTSYRSIVNITFMLNEKFGGKNPFGYHLVNIGIHIFNTILLYLLILEICALPSVDSWIRFRHRPIAFFTALLWSLNPVQLSAVTYVIQRYASLTAFFFMFSMLFYIKGRIAVRKQNEISYLVLCAFSGALAVFSKENAAILPVVLFILELLLIGGKRPHGNLKLGYYAVVISLVYVAGYIYLYRNTGYLPDYSPRPFNLLERILTEPRIIWFYISLLLYPALSRLSFMYDIPLSHTLTDPPATLLAITALAITLILSIAFSKRSPLLSFSILFFFITHLIESSIIPLELIFEHRNYLPSTFLSFFIIVLIFLLYEQIVKIIKIKLEYIYIVIAILALILAGNTYIRNILYKSSVSLYTDTVEKYPNLGREHLILGSSLMNSGRFEDGLYHLYEALEKDNFPTTGGIAEVYHNLSLYYRIVEPDYLRSFVFSLTANEITSKNMYLRNHAISYLMLGKIEQSQEILTQLEKEEPESIENKLLFAIIMLEKGMFNEAIVSVKQVAVKNDILLADAIIGEGYRRSGQFEQAIDIYEEIVEKLPLFIPANLIVLECLLNAKLEIEASEYVKKNYVIFSQINTYNIDDYNKYIGIPIIRPNLEIILEYLRKSGFFSTTSQ